MLDLEPRQFDLLDCLVQRGGELVTKDDLLEAVWGGRIVTDAAISQAVAKLRRGLREAGVEEDPIKTVHGHGYRWEAENATAPTPAAAPAPASPAATDRSPRRWRWLLAALVAAGGIFLGLRPQPAAAPVTLAVAPLAVAAGTQAEWAELGLASLLGGALDDRTNLRVLSPARVRSALRSRGLTPETASDEQLKALNELAGVDHLLLAQLDRSGGNYQVSYQVAGRGTSGTVTAGGIGGLAAALSQRIAQDLDVAYEAGIALKKISADEFVNEAFARGMQALLSGDAAGARSFFESALASDASLGWARYELGNALNQLGEWPASRAAFEEARDQGFNGNDLNLAGVAESGLGILAWREGRLADAEQHLLAARDQFEAVDNRANLASALGNLGILAENQGRLAEARDLYGQTLVLYRGAQERFGESAVYSNLAVMERKQGNLAAAEELQRRAVAIQEAAGLRQLLLFSYSHLGKIIFSLGRWDEGAGYVDQALALAEELGDKLMAAEARSAQAEQLILTGRLSEAEALLGEVIAVYQELNNPAGEAAAQLLLAQIANTRGDALAAGTRADLALDLYRDLTNPVMQAAALIQRAQADAATRSEDLAAALVIGQETADSSLLAEIAMTRGRLAVEPVPLFEQALGHARAAADRGLEAEVAVALGLALLERGQADDARLASLLGTAQTWQPVWHQTLYFQARLAEAQGDLTAALKGYEAARDAAGETWSAAQEDRLQALRGAGAG
ncbi:MAG: tetratricopeptide repeat protein [Pseudomonadota bacterium]